MCVCVCRVSCYSPSQYDWVGRPHPSGPARHGLEAHFRRAVTCNATSSSVTQPVSEIKSCSHDTTSGKEMFLFNTKINTFYLCLYGVQFTVNDDSDNERGNRFRHDMTTIFHTSNGSSRIAHTTTFVIPVVQQWLE